jgi:hypothetical protein
MSSAASSSTLPPSGDDASATAAPPSGDDASATAGPASMLPMGDAFQTVTTAAGDTAHDQGAASTVSAGETTARSGLLAKLAAVAGGVVARLRGGGGDGEQKAAAATASSGEDHDGDDGDSTDHAAAADAADSAAQAATTSSRPRWLLPALIGGGALAGSLAIAAVAWTLLSARAAEAQARVAALQEQTRQIDEQKAQLAEQAARIEALTRAARERSETDKGGEAAPVAAAAPLPAPPPAPAPAPAPVAATVPAPPARALAPSAPGQAGTGLCDIPSGPDAAQAMRKCIEWFSGAERSAAKTPAKP